MDINESLFRAILATVARGTFPAKEVYRIVTQGGSAKQLSAYNLCDGKTPQAEISKRTKLDSGNLSRSIARWVEAGVVVRVGPDQHPLHVYPLTKASLKAISAEK